MCCCILHAGDAGTSSRGCTDSRPRSLCPLLTGSRDLIFLFIGMFIALALVIYFLAKSAPSSTISHTEV